MLAIFKQFNRNLWTLKALALNVIRFGRLHGIPQLHTVNETKFNWIKVSKVAYDRAKENKYIWKEPKLQRKVGSYWRLLTTAETAINILAMLKSFWIRVSAVEVLNGSDFLEVLNAFYELSYNIILPSFSSHGSLYRRSTVNKDHLTLSCLTESFPEFIPLW